MNSSRTLVPRSLLFFLSLLLAFLLLGQTASADPAKIINGNANPDDAQPGTSIEIWADASLQSDCDDGNYGYLFDQWTVENMVGDGDELNILTNRYAEKTSFSIPAAGSPSSSLNSTPGPGRARPPRPAPTTSPTAWRPTHDKGGALTQIEMEAFLQEANPRNQPAEEE